MHFYALVRGQNELMRRYLMDASMVFLPFEYPARNEWKTVQMGVRPIQLVEFTFPEPTLKAAMGVLQPEHDWDKRMSGIAKILGKTMGLEKVPENVKPSNLIQTSHISVIPLGLKRDKYKNGIEMI